MSNKPEVLSAVHGIAPRSDELHRLGSAAEKGRASWEEFVALRAQETAEWLAAQEAAGIDIQEDGKLAWQDHLRPLVKASDGFSEGIDDAPVTRWFDTNRFYRRPTISGRLRFDIDRFQELTGNVGEHISLLAPDTFSALCDSEYSGLPAERHVRQWYDEIIYGLVRLGVKRITLESYPRRTERAVRDICQFAGVEPEVQFALISGNARPRLGGIPVGNVALGADAPELVRIQNIRQAEGHWNDYSDSELWFNITRGDTTTSQDQAVLYGQLFRLRPRCAVLTHALDLEQVPLPNAVRKLHELGETAQSIREQLTNRLGE